MKLFELIPFLSKNQQENQTQKNFERKFILSLIYWNKDEWLFAGIYESLSVKEANGICKYKYETKLTNIAEEFFGKLIVDFKKDFRASYLYLENQIDKFYVLELKREIAKVLASGNFNHSGSGENRQKKSDENDQKSHLLTFTYSIS